LQVRAALGAGRAALRRTLLAESLVLCGLGAVLAVLLGPSLVTVVSRFAARFSVSAQDVTVDASLLWVGVALAMIAAVVLAFVPRLPDAQAPIATATGPRVTPGTNRRLRVLAVTQIALSFVLLVGAGMLLGALVRLQHVRTGYDLRQVLALDVPLPIESFGKKAIEFYGEAARRIGELPGVKGVAVSNFVPWRDRRSLFARMPFTVEGYTAVDGEETPYAKFRNVTPGFFAAMGVPLLAGRDFTEDDRGDGELVVIVSQSLAERLFPNGDAVNRRFYWTEPMWGPPKARRIVGVVADVDDENVVPTPSPTVYHPLRQLAAAGRVFVHAEGDPYALVEPVTRVIREISPDQPVERAATLADVRTEVLAPERLNAFVLSGFATVALLIAVVGVGGVLAFSVNARTREFGVRLAVGSSPRRLIEGVLAEGAWIAGLGIAAGGAVSVLLAELAASRIENLSLPGFLPMAAAAALLLASAVVASLLPAARASRVDVVQALRSE
jgi:predicted permease